MVEREPIQSLTRGDLKVHLVVGQEELDASPLDVDVHTPDGCTYHGTFVTVEMVLANMHEHETTGEDLGGTYWWMMNVIILRQMTEVAILDAIEDLYSRSVLSHAMTRSFPSGRGDHDA